MVSEDSPFIITVIILAKEEQNKLTTVTILAKKRDWLINKTPFFNYPQLDELREKQ